MIDNGRDEVGIVRSKMVGREHDARANRDIIVMQEGPLEVGQVADVVAYQIRGGSTSNNVLIVDIYECESRETRTTDPKSRI